MSEHSGHAPEDDAFARLLPGALRTASDEFPGPSPDLIDRGHRRGRRMRRTRNIRVGVAATALAAVVLGGAYAVTGLGVGGSAGNTSGTAGNTTGSAAPASASTAGIPPVGAAEMLATLKGLLPAGGTFTEERGQGTAVEIGKPYGGAYASLEFTAADGGRSGVGVAVSRSQIPSECPPAQVQPHTRCTVTPLPDGSKLVSSRGYTYPSTDTGQKNWSAYVVRRDGVSVSVSVFGGGGEKATTSTIDPVLSIQQIEAIAQSPQWQAAAASVAHEAGPPPQSARTGLGGEVITLLKSFAPQGAKVTDESSSGDYATLVIDDGKGRSAVQINVQPDMGEALNGRMTCASRADLVRSCTQETLADGSELLLTKRTSEKGGTAVVWTADLLHADGLRVVVSSVNSFSEATQPTRTAPVFDLAELKTIATDTRWSAL